MCQSMKWVRDDYHRRGESASFACPACVTPIFKMIKIASPENVNKQTNGPKKQPFGANDQLGPPSTFNGN